MAKYVWIGIAGCFGALARYGLSGLVSGASLSVFPWGTLVVNVVGSLLLGFVAALGADAGIVPAPWRTAVTVGFLGAFTTFSTWSLETFHLIESKSYGHAVLNLVGSPLMGLFGVWLGVVLARLLVD